MFSMVSKPSWWLALAALLPATAHAQALNCKVPKELTAAPARALPSNVGMVPVTGAKLALSWSPQYCKTRQASSRDRHQCSGAFGRFGFIVHGLWVEGEGRNDPEYCAPAKPLSAATLARNFCMTPSAALLQHEWTKHGTCASSEADPYFDEARRLYSGLVFPNMDALSRQKLTVRQFQTAFARANPRVPQGAIAITTDRGGWLKEVQLCLDTRNRWRNCPREDRGAPPQTALRIWRSN